MLRKRLVLGTYAFMLPKQQRRQREANGDAATHEWICLLRCFDPFDDITKFIKKVIFTLHPSFAQPVRIIESAAESGAAFSPFQVEEVGWGEFEISCKLYFHPDVDTKPIEFKHYLRLYPEGTADIASIPIPDQSRQNCVVSETHDEVIFKCTASHEVLNFRRAQPENHPLSPHYGKGVAEEEDEYIAMQRLLNHAVNLEIEATKQKMMNKALEVQGLMNIYYTLRPDRALDLLAQYPKLLTMTAGAPAGSAEEESQRKELDQIMRNITRSLQGLPDTFATGKEKANECIQLFNDLVQKGFILNNSPTADSSSTPLPLASHR